MDSMSRLLSGFLLFGALLLGLASLSAEWLVEQCAPLDRFGNRISLLEEQRKGERLSRELHETLERIRTKETIIAELASGEMSLFEAAAWFRALYEDVGTWPNPCRPLPAYDEGEGWCRAVIAYAEIHLQDKQSPSQAGTVRQRLEAVLQEQLERHGAVKLPN